jgi:hypothetical protein
MCCASLVEVLSTLISIYPTPRESSPLLSVLYNSTTVFPTHIHSTVDVTIIFLDLLLL